MSHASPSPTNLRLTRGLPGSLAGWHPLGLIGIVAALLGVLMVALAIPHQTPTSTPRPDAAVDETPPALRLELQRSGIEERLARFPTARQRDAQIALIGALADDQGVALGSGEYRDAASPMPADLAMLEVRLPLRGKPAAVRSFLAGLQREAPWLAIDHLSIERDGGEWRAEVRGRLFLRLAA